jgi:predicted dehydrogenase
MGTGDIAGTMTETLQSVGSPVVAVGSGTPVRAEVFAAEHGIPTAVGSHQAVAGAEDVDIVYVATTHDLHYQNVLDAVAAGKHVLCEKAIALNAHQAREMFAAATKAGVVLMEAMWMRFCPFIVTIDELIASGVIGEVGGVEVFFGYVPPESRRWTDRRLGGGALLDLGVYSLSLAHHLLGSPTRCEALAFVDEGVDVDVRVVAHHEGETASTAGATFLSDPTNEAIIGGRTGRLRVHAPFHHSPKITLERRGEVVETYDTSFAGHGFRFEVAEIERCVASGLTESPLRPHADTLAVMEWMDAIRSRIGVVFPGDGG